MSTVDNRKPYDPQRDNVPLAPVAFPRNLCCQEGAEMLAAELDEWWHSRGFPQVHHWAVSNNARAGITWNVRGNLVNGLPPKRLP